MTVEKVSNISEGWPHANQYSRSIRWEFSIYISALILILMLAAGAVLTDKYMNTVTGNVVEKLIVQARSYSGPAGKHLLAAEGPDALMLSNICRKLAEESADVYWVAIADKNGKLTAHTNIREVVAGNSLEQWSGREYFDILRKDEKFTIVGDTVKINIPIRENNIDIGSLEIAATTNQIHQAKWNSIIAMATTTLLLIVIGIPFSMFILHRKLKPMSIITGNLQNIDFENIAIDIPIKSRNEFGYLADTLRVMGNRLNLAQKELVERERISREYEIAREIQEKILPRSFPVAKQFDIAGAYKSAREIGGDYYDFIDYGDGRLGILIADVSGKSLPGMLVMLLTRDIVKQVSRSICEPGVLLSAVNRELLPSIKKGMFVTMSYGLLDTRTGDFSFASAGHNPLVHYIPNGDILNLLRPKGFPLGMMPPAAFDARLEVGKIRLLPSDWLIQYTDGVNEAQNNNGEDFGMNRFEILIKQYSGDSAGKLVQKILSSVEVFTGESAQSDDITILAMRWMGHKDEIKIENKKQVSVAD
jgi:serine phosphatase RsbU (regulator of sigma subunit)